MFHLWLICASDIPIRFKDYPLCNARNGNHLKLTSTNQFGFNGNSIFNVSFHFSWCDRYCTWRVRMFPYVVIMLRCYIICTSVLIGIEFNRCQSSLVTIIKDIRYTLYFMMKVWRFNSKVFCCICFVLFCFVCSLVCLFLFLFCCCCCCCCCCYCCCCLFLFDCLFVCLFVFCCSVFSGPKTSIAHPKLNFFFFWPKVL